MCYVERHSSQWFYFMKKEGHIVELTIWAGIFRPSAASILRDLHATVHDFTYRKKTTFFLRILHLKGLIFFFCVDYSFLREI